MAKKDQSIKDKLKEALKEHLKHDTALSKGGEPFFFPEYETNLSEKFIKLFGLDKKEPFNKDSFEKAFKIATEGNGDEIKKINSVISSALLPLLLFYPLFEGEKSEITLEIDGKEITFNKVFFEVRNMVIDPNKPSCVDIVLQSKDGSTLLYLESKLSEYITPCKKKISEEYFDLYDRLYTGKILKGFNEPTIDSNTHKMVLSTPSVYIEGIKQSISHLIGLVQGPRKYTRSVKGYPLEYLNEYKKAYETAERLIYGTILFDPKELGVGEAEYEAYCKLYNDIIGANGDKIIEAIKDSEIVKRGGTDKEITVLKSALSYQKLLDDNAYRKNIPDNVLYFYGFKKP